MATLSRQGRSTKLQRQGKGDRKCNDGRSPLRTTKSGKPVVAGCPGDSPYSKGRRFK